MVREREKEVKERREEEYKKKGIKKKKIRIYTKEMERSIRH